MIKYTYKGVEHNVDSDTTTLTTSGKYLEDNISINSKTEIEFSQNSASFSSVTIIPNVEKIVIKDTYPYSTYCNLLSADVARVIEVRSNTGEIRSSRQTSMAQAMRACTAEEIGLFVDFSNVTNIDILFYGCTNLRRIYGVPMNFVNVLSTSNPPFSSLPNLEEIDFAKNCLKLQLNFSQSSKLTNQSLVNIANGLNEATTGRTLTLHATPKAKLETIKGNVSLDSTETYHIFTMGDSGSTTLLDFIVDTKGWGVA